MCKVCVQKGCHKKKEQGKKGKKGKGVDKKKKVTPKEQKKVTPKEKKITTKENQSSNRGKGEFELFVLCFKLVSGALWIIKSDKDTKSLMAHINNPKYELETSRFSIYQVIDPTFDVTKRNIGDRFKNMNPISLDLKSSLTQQKTNQRKQEKKQKQVNHQQKPQKTGTKSQKKQLKNSKPKDWPKCPWLIETEGSLKWKIGGDSKNFKPEEFSKKDEAKQFIQDIDDCVKGKYSALTCGVHDRYVSMCVVLN